MTIGTRPYLQPLSIIGSKLVSTPQGPRKYVLVQWVTLTANEATWEPLDHFSQSFLHIDLEDKVSFNEGGNDTPQPMDQEPMKINRAASQPNEENNARHKRNRKLPARLVDYEL